MTVQIQIFDKLIGAVETSFSNHGRKFASNETQDNSREQKLVPHVANFKIWTTKSEDKELDAHSEAFIEILFHTMLEIGNNDPDIV